MSEVAAKMTSTDGPSGRLAPRQMLVKPDAWSRRMSLKLHSAARVVQGCTGHRSILTQGMHHVTGQRLAPTPSPWSRAALGVALAVVGPKPVGMVVNQEPPPRLV